MFTKTIICVLLSLLTVAPFCSLGQSGIITTFAGTGAADTTGDGGPATDCALYYPTGITFDATGGAFIIDGANRTVRKISAAGIISHFSGLPGDYTYLAGIATGYDGKVFFTDRGQNRIFELSSTGIANRIAGFGTTSFSGDGGQATHAGLARPTDITADEAGNIYFTDQENHRVRKIAIDGIITTVAGNGTDGFSGDGGDATAASLNFPGGIAVDHTGNLFIADCNNNRVRKVTTDGKIVTIAGTGTGGYSGDGGAAAAAEFYYPGDVMVTPNGSLIVTDVNNHVVRRIKPDGAVETIAGTGTRGFSGDSIPATSAQLWFPWAVTHDNHGNLYITEMGSHRIRKIAGAIEVSVNEYMAEHSKRITIFPNPAYDKISVTVPTQSMACNATVTVIDCLGNAVQRVAIKSSTTTISIADIADGMYLLRLQNAQASETTRFIKAK